VLFLSATKENILEEFQRIKGIDKKIALALYNARIRSLKELENVEVSKLSKLIGIEQTTIKEWIEKIPQQLVTSEVEDSIQILSSFLNISEEIAEKLRNVGVFSIKHLSEEVPELLADDLEMPVKTVLEWIKKAKTHVRQKK